MDAIEQVKELVTQMDEEDLRQCWEVFCEIGNQRRNEAAGKDLRKEIILNTVKMKAKAKEIPTDNFTDDVEGFQKNMRDLEDGIMSTVRKIEQFIQYQAAEKAREYAQDLVTKGVDFCEIVVKGHRIVVTNEGGAVLTGDEPISVPDDEIPF